MLYLARNMGDNMKKNKEKIVKEKKEKVVKEKKKSKKLLVIILSIVIVILIGCGVGGYFFYQSKALKVKMKKIITVPLNTEVYNTDAFQKIHNGDILTKKEKLDTSKIGKSTITIKIKNYFKKIKTYRYQLVVIDKEAPVITFNPKLTIEEGNELNLLDGVSANDDSNEEIPVTVEGEYDFKTPGEYHLTYVAKDSSGNEKREEFVLEVTKKVVIINRDSYVAPDTSFTTSNGHHGVVKGGVTYIDGILIANKTYTLPASYAPGGLTSEFVNNFNNMKAGANAEGVDFDVFSGYRSYYTQKSTYQGWVNKDGKAAADTYSARPGHSEHQSGLAADINGYGARFDESKATEWMANNAYKYGFILRYPKGKQGITGYVYESWHFRYVGVDLATKLYNGGNWITLEEYFGITSEYNY